MHIIYRTFLCLLAALPILVSCSMDPIAEQITIENHKISLTFNREKFDFQKLNEINELNPIAIGDSLRAKAIDDTITVEFKDLIIESKVDTFRLAYPTDMPVYPGGIPIPSLDYTLTKNNIPSEESDQQFEFAKVDTGTFRINALNEYRSLNFKSVQFTLTNKNGEVVFTDSINDLYHNQSGSTGAISLNHKMITDQMVLKARVKTLALTSQQNTSGVSHLDSIKLNYLLGKCAFDSARANFEPQKVVSDTLQEVDMSSIFARRMELKNARLDFKVINNSSFKLGMGIAIDSLKDLQGKKYYQKISVDPKSTTDVLKDLKKWVLAPRVNDQQAVFIKDTTFCSAVSPDGMVTFRKTDKVKFITSLYGWDSQLNKKERIKASWIDGKMDKSVLEIKNEARAVSGDINWSNFGGILADSLRVKLKLDVNRDDFKLSEIKFENFKIQGRKTLANGGSQTHSAWYDITIPTMTNVNDTSVFITGFEQVINFHPDTLVYSVKALTSFDGRILDTDAIKLELGFGVPLQISTDPSLAIGAPALTQKGDVLKQKALSDSGNIDIEAVRINIDALINNPKGIDAKMRLTVLYSDQIVPTYDAKDDSLIGNIDTMMTVVLQKDFNNKPYYTLSNIMGKPIEINKAAITQILKKKTYIQQTIQVLNQGSGHPIVMKPDDFIEVQLQISGDLNITLDTK